MSCNELKIKPLVKYRRTIKTTIGKSGLAPITPARDLIKSVIRARGKGMHKATEVKPYRSRSLLSQSGRSVVPAVGCRIDWTAGVVEFHDSGTLDGPGKGAGHGREEKA